MMNCETQSSVPFIPDYCQIQGGSSNDLCMIIEKSYTSPHITHLEKHQVFVFGSNQEGKHYSGSAKIACEQFGAQWGVAQGLTGQCYAIPTMTRPQTEAKEVIKCSPEELDDAMRQFIQYARVHPQLQFLMTRVGCGVAAWGTDYMKDLFRKYYDPMTDRNIVYPVEFEKE